MWDMGYDGWCMVEWRIGGWQVGNVAQAEAEAEAVVVVLGWYCTVQYSI